MHKSRVLALLIVFCALSAQAITYIVPTDRDLVKSAQAIVIGTAMASHPELTAGGSVVTVADLQVESVLKGTISGDSIRIVEPGGFMSERTVMIPGSPRFEQGTRYLLFLEKAPTGEWRTVGFQLGQFLFTTDLRGREFVSRGGDEWIFGLDARDGSPYLDVFRDAAFFESFVRTVVEHPEAPARDEYFVDRTEVLLARDSVFQPKRKFVIIPNFTRPSYLLSGNFRWQFGPTAGWGYCCPGNYPAAPLNGPSAAGSAVTAWNGNSTSIAYVMGGETPGKTGGLSTADGANTVLFNDPNNIIGSSGAIAVGGISSAVGTYMLPDGFTYANTQEVDVVVTQNSKIPGFVTQSLFVSILTHEVGHTLGFRHANGTAAPSSPPPPCDPATDCANSNCFAGPPFAVMASCIGAPGLSLQTWDNNARQTVYGSGPVCTPPSITSGPTANPSMINSGQSSTLTVGAGGTAPFTYQWYQGAPPSTATPLGMTASIVVSPTSTTQYWVRVTGQCAPVADSTAVTVTVACTPVITAQPQDQQVTSGGTATLTVAFTSATATTVTWYRGFAGDTSNQVGTGTSFTTPPITSNTPFWAQLTNACGSTNTRTATISVAQTCTPPSGAVASASPTTINAGQSVALQVLVTGTNPLSFQWFRGTAPDQSNPIVGGTAFAINDTPSTTTSYWVRATNPCGFANSNTVTVTVIGAPTCTPPAIIANPDNVTIQAGTSTTLSVAASGTNLHFQWFKGSLGDTTSPVGSDSATFTTPALNTDTQFWVHVQNDCGAVNSGTVTVTVKQGRRRSVHH